MGFYERKKEERYKTKGNYDNWDAGQKNLEQYCPSHITFNDVDVDFIKVSRPEIRLQVMFAFFESHPKSKMVFGLWKESTAE